jgi:hypothetical protein
MIKANHRVAIYLRVSTLDQTTANQERELREVSKTFQVANGMGRALENYALRNSAVPMHSIQTRFHLDIVTRWSSASPFEAKPL